MAKFETLTLELINQGGFLEDGNAELDRLQETFVKFIREYDGCKASAKLTLEVNLNYDPKAGKEAVAVVGKMKTTMPARPPTHTTAIAGQRDDDKDSLFVHVAGSRADSPRQDVLCTDRGEPIRVDRDTGEVLGGAKK